MDSDLAAKLQKEEDEKYAQDVSHDSQFPMESEITVTTELDDDVSVDASAFTGDEDNDYLVALMLQHEYNNEFNGMMKKYESAVNRNSKGKFIAYLSLTRSHDSVLVKVSMKNFMLLPAERTNPGTDSVLADDDDDLEEVKETSSDCERGLFTPRFLVRLISVSDHPMPAFNRRGTSGKGETLVTKHNAELCGKRNVSRVMNTFPPEFDTGNVLNDMQLSNRVYNQLRLHSYAEEKRMNRLHDKVEKATAVGLVCTTPSSLSFPRRP